LFALLNIAPSLGSINVSFLGVGSPLSGHAPATSGVPHLDVSSLRERFFDLMAINAVGTGAIIGAFAEGKPKYGLVHSLALLGATVVAFVFLAP
ncbi:MAG TPA: hypothetical protein VEY07_07935, partial [Thermoplasmata archaeon]|nr:hypothetical protein [Thermoplasmata archaeon]